MERHLFNAKHIISYSIKFMLNNGRHFNIDKRQKKNIFNSPIMHKYMYQPFYFELYLPIIHVCVCVGVDNPSPVGILEYLFVDSEEVPIGNRLSGCRDPGVNSSSPSS